MDSKRLILTEVVKKGKTRFSTTEIQEATELSQQLVSYHLTQLRNQGYLSKEAGKRGLFYTTDESELLHLLLEQKVRATATKPSTAQINPNYMKQYELIRAMRAFDFKGQEVLENLAKESLERLIENVKQLKRWYIESTPKKEQAYETLKEYDFEELWAAWNTLKHSYTELEWNEKVDDINLLMRELRNV